MAAASDRPDDGVTALPGPRRDGDPGRSDPGQATATPSDSPTEIPVNTPDAGQLNDRGQKNFNDPTQPTPDDASTNKGVVDALEKRDTVTNPREPLGRDTKGG